VNISRPGDLDLWPLTLNLGRVIDREVVNFSSNFGLPRAFRSRLISQYLSDASRDLATLTFNLEGHGACRWCGSSCSVCVPSLKFVGLLVRKILDIYCVSINRPGDLDLWPLSRFTQCPVMGFHPPNFGLPRPFRSRVMLRHVTDRRTDRQKDRQPRAIYNTPSPTGAGHNNINRSAKLALLTSSVCDNHMNASYKLLSLAYSRLLVRPHLV